MIGLRLNFSTLFIGTGGAIAENTAKALGAPDVFKPATQLAEVPRLDPQHSTARLQAITDGTAPRGIVISFPQKMK